MAFSGLGEDMRIKMQKGYYYIGKVNILGLPHGFGREYNAEDKLIYEGNWSFGRYHGKGVYYHCWDSGKHEGTWRHGKRHGEGVEYSDDGSKKVGVWSKDDLTGEGVWYNPDGSIRYKGEFVCSMPGGNGVMYYENGDRYEGGFRACHRDGYGTYYFKSGGRFEGSWSLNNRLGDGIEYTADGIVYKGRWLSDKFYGKVTVQYPLGAVYEREYDEKGNLLKETRIDNLSDNQYVFISYSSKNREYAESARQLLISENIRTWMAPHDIPAGSKYAHVINDAIENSACVLLVLTEQSQASEWVAKEIGRAVDCKKTIISMHLDESKLNGEFGFYLGNQQIVSVKTINKDDDSIKRVLQAIKFFPK